MRVSALIQFASVVLLTVTSLAGIGVSSLAIGGYLPPERGRWEGFASGLIPALAPLGFWLVNRAQMAETRRAWVRQHGRLPPVPLVNAHQLTMWMVVPAAIPMLWMLIIMALPRSFHAWTRWYVPINFAWIACIVVVATMLTRSDSLLAKEIEDALKSGRDPCMSCGYDLTHVGSPRCSECGELRLPKSPS